MSARYRRAGLPRHVLLLLAFVGIVPCHAAADSHPQEVLDLVASYDALAMKVRPLQKRVVVSSKEEGSTGFRPDGTPVRARGDASPSGDDAALLGRLNALEQRILAERERVNRPEYGAGLRGTRATRESGNVQFGDGVRGTRPPPEKEQQKLEQLQRELAELEREVEALEKRRMDTRRAR